MEFYTSTEVGELEEDEAQRRGPRDPQGLGRCLVCQSEGNSSIRVGSAPLPLFRDSRK